MTYILVVAAMYVMIAIAVYFIGRWITHAPKFGQKRIIWYKAVLISAFWLIAVPVYLLKKYE